MIFARFFKITSVVFFAIATVGASAWEANPPVVSKLGDIYDVSITPHNSDVESGYDGFTISIKNHKDFDIYVVWAETFYIRGSKSYGYFYSYGDRWSQVDNPKSDDVVFANSTFAEEIFPSKLVRYDAGSRLGGWIQCMLCARGYYSSAMPAGVNGIHLTVKLPGNKEVHNTITLVLGP